MRHMHRPRWAHQVHAKSPPVHVLLLIMLRHPAWPVYPAMVIDMGPHPSAMSTSGTRCQACAQCWWAWYAQARPSRCLGSSCLRQACCTGPLRLPRSTATPILATGHKEGACERLSTPPPSTGCPRASWCCSPPHPFLTPGGRPEAPAHGWLQRARPCPCP